MRRTDSTRQTLRSHSYCLLTGGISSLALLAATAFCPMTADAQEDTWRLTPRSPSSDTARAEREVAKERAPVTRSKARTSKPRTTAGKTSRRKPSSPLRLDNLGQNDRPGASRVVRAVVNSDADEGRVVATGFHRPIATHGSASVCCDDESQGLIECGDECSEEDQLDYGFEGYPCWGLKNRLWVKTDYLLWWAQGDILPPLVTTGPAGAIQANAGRLDQGATVLFGNAAVNEETRSGGRMTFGYRLGDTCTWSAEGSFLSLGNEVARFSDTSTGTPFIARPFYNIVTAQDDAVLVAYPGFTRGNIAVSAATEFTGAEALLRRVMFRQDAFQMDLVLGYRFQRLDDDLRVDTHIVGTGGAALGTTLDLFDEFTTENQFHGLEFGTILTERCGRWTLELMSKVAFGNTRSTVNIDGFTVNQGSGGMLALDSNIGYYESNDFSVIPELGLTIGYDVTPCLRLTFGYTFIYWSKVARPGDQVDLDVNETLFPPAALVGPARPEFNFTTTDYRAQGMNFGLEYRF